MDRDLQIFSSDQFGQIRTITIDDQPYFVANDICKALGYANARDSVSRHVYEDDVVKHDIIDTLGRVQQSTFISESGLYALVFGSKLPSAKQFKRWVTSDILPTIRKHGAYLTQEKIAQALPDPDTIIELAITLKQEREQKKFYREQMNLQSEVIKEIAPKANYYDQVLHSESVYVADQIAKELGMTAIKLNRKLELLNIQFRRNGQWVLKAKYGNCGYTKTRTHIYTQCDGKIGSVSRTVWTEKGREFIHKLLKND